MNNPERLETEKLERCFDLLDSHSTVLRSYAPLIELARAELAALKTELANLEGIDHACDAANEHVIKLQADLAALKSGGQVVAETIYLVRDTDEGVIYGAFADSKAAEKYKGGRPLFVQPIEVIPTLASPAPVTQAIPKGYSCAECLGQGPNIESDAGIVHKAGCSLAKPTSPSDELKKLADETQDYFAAYHARLPDAPGVDCKHENLMRHQYCANVWWQCEEGCDFIFRPGRSALVDCEKLAREIIEALPIPREIGLGEMGTILPILTRAIQGGNRA